MNRTVVIYHPGALGDVLLAVPAIKRVALRFPGREIVLVAQASVGRLLAECRVIDKWISIESQGCAGLFSRVGLEPGEVAACFERCEAAVAWVEDVDGSLAHGLRECGVPEVWIRSPFSPTLRGVHQSDRFLETIGEDAATVLGPEALTVPRHLLERGRCYLADNGIQGNQLLVLIHPGSGSLHKCLRPDKMASLVETLEGKGMFPVLLEGPADHCIVDVLLRLLSKPTLVLRGLDLSLLAGVLSQSHLYIGHDSGVTHLAALLGLRTLAIFGSTDPARWAPRGSHATIVRGGPCICPSWDSVKTCQEKPCLDFSVSEMLTTMRLTVTA